MKGGRKSNAVFRRSEENLLPLHFHGSKPPVSQPVQRLLFLPNARLLLPRPLTLAYPRRRAALAVHRVLALSRKRLPAYGAPLPTVRFHKLGGKLRIGWQYGGEERAAAQGIGDRLRTDGCILAVIQQHAVSLKAVGTKALNQPPDLAKLPVVSHADHGGMLTHFAPPVPALCPPVCACTARRCTRGFCSSRSGRARSPAAREA